jgi:predicted SnoaL-like aldol condensation-catalyzing enzyme
MATFDLFRVADGLIVEHWDNSELVPDGPQPNSGKF